MFQAHIYLDFTVLPIKAVKSWQVKLITWLTGPVRQGNQVRILPHISDVYLLAKLVVAPPFYGGIVRRRC